MPRQHFESVDQYIATFPAETRVILEKIRKMVRKGVPGGEEVISYQIPCYKLNGKYVIYFAGFAKHVSLYPIPHGSVEFNKAIAPYVKGKGTVQFQLKEPVPYDLVKQMIGFSLKENLARM